MDSKQELLKYIDTQRWLINNGLFSEPVKNQLFTYGTLAHPEVRAVELDIDVENKILNYKIYLPNSLIKKVERYKKLSKSTSFWGLRRFRRFLKKEGDLNFENIVQGFITDYCGPGWQANIEVVDFANYSEDDSETGVEVSTTQDREAN